jgi:hypothetical protein
LIPAALALASCAPSRDEMAVQQRATIERFCYDCHNKEERTANLSLESLDLRNVGHDPGAWEHVSSSSRPA